MEKQKQKKFSTPWNYTFKDATPEKKVGISQTVKGESYSIRDLMVKNQSGNLPPILRNAQYSENPDFDSNDLEEIMRMDLNQKHELLDIVRNNVQNLNNELNKERQQRAKQVEEEAYKKAEKLLADRPKLQP